MLPTSTAVAENPRQKRSAEPEPFFPLCFQTVCLVDIPDLTPSFSSLTFLLHFLLARDLQLDRKKSELLNHFARKTIWAAAAAAAAAATSFPLLCVLRSQGCIKLGSEEKEEKYKYWPTA